MSQISITADYGAVATAGTSPPPPPPSTPPDAPQPNTAPAPFTADQLYWSAVSSTDVVDVYLQLDPTATQITFDKSSDGSPTVVSLDPSQLSLSLEGAPVGITPLKMSDGTWHPQLVVCRYVDCVTIENPWPAALLNYTGTLTIKVNGAQVFQQSSLNFWLRSRLAPIRTGLPQITPSRNWPSWALPNYGNPGPYKQPTLQGNTISGINRLSPDGIGYSMFAGMGSTGGRVDIAPIPGWDVPWVTQGTYWDVCRTANDHSAVWPIHLRDPVNGMILDPSKWKYATVVTPLIKNPAMSGGNKNPIAAQTSCPYSPNGAHQTHFATVPYLSTGSDFDMEEMLSWGLFDVIELSPVSTGTGACYAVGAARRVAWVLVQFGYNAKLLPDSHPYKAVYQTALNNSLDLNWNGKYAPGASEYTEFGFYVDTPYADVYGRLRGMAPWMNHYLATALNLLVQYGFTGYTPWRDMSAKFAVDSMYKMCYQMGTLYNFYVANPAVNNVVGHAYSNDGVDMLGSWEDIKVDTLLNSDLFSGDIPTRLSAACGTLALGATLGDMANSAGITGQSYPGMMYPALSAAVDAGIPHAEAMFKLITDKGVYKIRWTDSGENYIQPRVAYDPNATEPPYVHPDRIVCNATLLPVAPPAGGTYLGTIYAVCFGSATGPVTISASGLPAGLSVGTPVDHGNGVFSADVTGVPTDMVKSTAAVTVTNGTLSGNQTIVITPVNPLSISVSGVPSTLVVGTVINATVVVTCKSNSTNVSLGYDVLPAGLSLGSTPTVSGNKYTFTLTGTLTAAASTTSTFSASDGTYSNTSKKVFNVTP